MKKLSLIFLLTTFSLFGQNDAKTCETLSKINALLQREHYQPKPIDDSLSVFVFDGFLDALDSNRNLFTKIEYKKLREHRLQLDNYILQNNCSFMNDFVAVYTLALNRKKKVLEKIQKDSFDYTSNDSVKFSKKKFPFDLVATDLERVWKKRIRYDILEDISKSSTNLDSLNQNFSALEKTTKTKLFDANLCQVNSILETKDRIASDLQNTFMNLFCTYFDPHSNYFSLAAKSSFMSGLSTSSLSLGLNVGFNDKEEIIVQEIVPGGPAAKTNKFDKNDIILKVSDTKGTTYTVSCSSIEKIGELIFSDSNTDIELTIQKKNAAIVTVFLRKQVMKATDNAVYSYIAEKESKIGYINIPNFYSNFDGNTVQGCADDVAKEIVKLQKDNIKGLVIDLQNNGGGSIQEAIKLAGMFIDIGPLSVLVDSKDQQTILKDYNRGSVYSGPLVLLMNGNSASASEFFAAAIQDYNRGIIIGSTSLGKASMQAILPLDKNNQEDFVKVTIEKFYRITGDSNQIKGIVPDIMLPVLFDSINPREVSYKTALKNDVIITKARFSPLPKTYFPQLTALSHTRVKENIRFNEINVANQQINALYNNPKKPTRLVLKDVFDDVHKIDTLWEKVKKIIDSKSNFTLSNTTYDLEKLKFDTFQQDSNTYKIENLKNSPYLEEAIAILNDYNTLTK
ncbi:carboxy terminal-processing peptidase [Flavobacterium xueshanense]|uniref:Carboxyl-terminal processing protease n=1 Tax=Flavobacterium xueshanense TaxID=935223 RepID=A0A1I2G9K6_9FLAO|nr:carboxy terminal-processing peptidase [Flavobacterium xueshanense]SFF13416.1 carboxyl-terminal processing protease [Flavobacterium xueshanense]